MTIRRILALTGLALYIGLGIVALVRHYIPEPPPWESHPCATCTFIHEPPVGCPADSIEAPKFFTEKNGDKLDACYRKDGDGAVDVLMPGESCVLSFGVVPDEGENSQPTRKN